MSHAPLRSMTDHRVEPSPNAPKRSSPVTLMIVFAGLIALLVALATFRKV